MRGLRRDPSARAGARPKAIGGGAKVVLRRGRPAALRQNVPRFRIGLQRRAGGPFRAPEREAMLLIGRLEAEGIPARPGVIRSQLVPIVFGTQEQIEVLVRADRLDEARAVLGKFQRAARPDASAPEEEPSPRSGSDAWADANERVWGSESEG